MTPKGVSAFLPEATAQKRHVEEVIFSVFKQWGYREVIPPLFEYLDVIASGLSEGLIEKGYKFVDRSDGRVMLLRPDVTPQIARMVAMQMSDRAMPLRLCYRANVFRHEEEHAGRAREMFQIGGELVGINSPEADAEVILIAIESLAALGLTDFSVTVSHSEFFRGYLDSLDLPPEIKRQIQSAVGRKDVAQIRSVVKAGRISKSAADALIAMPMLFGGPEAIGKAERLTRAPGCRRALKRLREVMKIIAGTGWKDCLVVDLAEMRGFEYYTGTVFEIFVKNLGFAVGRGGRYDHLVGRFGPALPSTGFAFDIENVQSAWQDHVSGRLSADNDVYNRSADILLIDSTAKPDRLFRFAKRLRDMGLRVVQSSVKLKTTEAASYAAALGIQAVAVLGGAGRISVTDTLTRKSKTLKEKTFLEQVPGRPRTPPSRPKSVR